MDSLEGLRTRLIVEGGHRLEGALGAPHYEQIVMDQEHPAGYGNGRLDAHAQSTAEADGGAQFASTAGLALRLVPGPDERRVMPAAPRLRLPPARRHEPPDKRGVGMSRLAEVRKSA